MTPQELDDWLRRSLDYLTSTSGELPWDDAQPENRSEEKGTGQWDTAR